MFGFEWLEKPEKQGITAYFITFVKPFRCDKEILSSR